MPRPKHEEVTIMNPYYPLAIALYVVAALLHGNLGTIL
ncbi:hypothetical protein GFS60_06372 (plasmid) [Rhodococcus sp. WAY2]|nr:hypothetical protein GFS60_06372 [Rhodococcus sp. WAY2]